MRVKLYWFRFSHPAQAVRRMLELKEIPYDLAGVLPGNQRVHLRLAGFRDGTVPAMKIDGRRVQGSRAIARALEELQPEPRLFPVDRDEWAAVEDAERWGDEVLQSVPRRIVRWGLVHDAALREWLAAEHSIPAPGIAARLTGLNARYYARVVAADEEHARRDVATLPEVLDHVDGLLADGTLAIEQPNAAAYQVLCSVRSLEVMTDLHDLVAARPCSEAARRLFPEPFTETPAPAFLPRDWLA